jgi:hypothetical protein
MEKCQYIYLWGTPSGPKGGDDWALSMGFSFTGRTEQLRMNFMKGRRKKTRGTELKVLRE